MGGQDETAVDVVVVGAGFAGLYALHRLRGDGFRVRCVEAGGDVGGTWYWNRYPGARCDVESLDYSYSFSSTLEQDWDWTERYATQPEILRYLQHVTDRFDLRRDITFDTQVEAAAWDESRRIWTVRTPTGDLRSRFLLLATGPLSAANVPDLPGLADFAGRTFHTGAWPHQDIDFQGRRVAVIGTGSSGIQLIPRVAEQAVELHVLQRTPNFSIPAQNWTWNVPQLALAKADYANRRARSRQSAAGTPHPQPDTGTFDVDDEERQRIFEERWQVGGARFTRAFTDLVSDRTANAQAVGFVHDKIRKIVRSPEVATRLLPRGYPLGAKRICVDTGYYDTFNRDNVHLIDLRQDPIERIETHGVRMQSGLVPLDDLVFATGFDAMTGAVNRIHLAGRDGVLLRDEWSDGPHSALGMAVAGFPNLFLLNGPGSPSVLANMVLTSEQQVDWIAGLLIHARRNGTAVLEATAVAQRAWGEHCSALTVGSLMLDADSWYVGANIPGKPRVLLPYLGGLARYAQECQLAADHGYRAFIQVPEGVAVESSLCTPDVA